MDSAAAVTGAASKLWFVVEIITLVVLVVMAALWMVRTRRRASTQADAMSTPVDSLRFEDDVDIAHSRELLTRSIERRKARKEAQRRFHTPARR